MKWMHAMKWVLRLLGLAVVAFLLIRLPGYVSRRVCSHGLDDPAGACRHVVAIWVFILAAGVLHIPVVVWIVRNGTWRWGPPRRSGIWIDYDASQPGWQESFTAASDCPTGQPDPGPSDCAGSRE
jgi:hypothetical protein